MAFYEDFQYLEQWPHQPVLEAYSGTQVVMWGGDIERQLQRYVEEFNQSKNSENADKTAAFLQIWRANPFDGSINVETIDILQAAASVLAVDRWKLGDYFSHLRDRLRELKASVEQLPPMGEVPEEEPMGGPSGRPHLSAQPNLSEPSQDFGPQAEPPPGDEADTAGGGVGIRGVPMRGHNPGGGGI